MKILIEIGVGVGVIAAIWLLLIVAKIKKTIKAHGIETIILRWLTGRHHAHHPNSRHTTATFRHDSNGKVINGTPSSRVLKRHHRAGWKNVLRSIGWMTIIGVVVAGLIDEFLITTIITIAAVIITSTYRGRKFVIGKKKARAHRDIRRSLARVLANVPGTSEVDMEANIHLKDNYLSITKGSLGTIDFPDTFAAHDGEQTMVSDIVNRRLPVETELRWKPPSRGRMQYAELVTAPPLPSEVKFADHLDDINKCNRYSYVIGYDRMGMPVVLKHDGDRPMKAFSMDSGTGKSTMLRMIAAQIMHKDPSAKIFVFDTKRISLEMYRGVPGVTLYNDPRNMQEMWDGWYAIKKEMDRRYETLKVNRTAEFDIWWILGDEMNDFGVQIKKHWDKELKGDYGKNPPSNPPIWYEIAEVLWQGREVGIFVDVVLQNFMERYFGGMSLRSSFQTYGMAGFTPNQYKAIIQRTPVPKIQEGQGRILIVEGVRETWVQGLYAPNEWLLGYVYEVRRRPAAKTIPEEIEKENA